MVSYLLKKVDEQLERYLDIIFERLISIYKVGLSKQDIVVTLLFYDTNIEPLDYKAISELPDDELLEFIGTLYNLVDNCKSIDSEG